VTQNAAMFGTGGSMFSTSANTPGRRSPAQRAVTMPSPQRGQGRHGLLIVVNIYPLLANSVCPTPAALERQVEDSVASMAERLSAAATGAGRTATGAMGRTRCTRADLGLLDAGTADAGAVRRAPSTGFGCSTAGSGVTGGLVTLALAGCGLSLPQRRRSGRAQSR